LVIRVGPAGWSYPDWEGKVYPLLKPRGFHALAYLARYFDCVEVNSTFYAMPRREHAERWVQLVADRPTFRFTVKLNREFTHTRAPHAEDSGFDWEAAAREFNTGIEPLARTRRLHCLLVQFPAGFLFGKSEVRLLGRIKSCFSEVPLVLEVRHNSWFTPPALDTVRGLSYSLAYIDLPPAWNHPPAWHAPTGPIAYMRLHGQNREHWFRRDAGRDQKYDHLYTRDELAPLADKARRLSTFQSDVMVITNNHFEGKAVANAIELRAMLEGAPVSAPPELVGTYPELRSITRVEGQQRLF
jgi:uncharacterized protein YecE (DUF72 family)